MTFTKIAGLRSASALALMAMIIPNHAVAQQSIATDAECAQIIGDMGLSDINTTGDNSANLPESGSGSNEGSNPGTGSGSDPSTGDNTSPPMVGGEIVQPLPEPGPEPVPAPEPSPIPVPTPKPAPVTPPGIALPNGSAASCSKGVKMSQSDNASVSRAKAAKSTLQAAAKKHGIDWRLLAAIGVRETNFRNIDSTREGDPGLGVFQLTNQPGVTKEKAHNLAFAADYAARMLKSNMNYLKRKFPKLTQAELLQATAASYNFGLGNISGDPKRIDVGTTRNNYGQNILLLMNCF